MKVLFYVEPHPVRDMFTHFRAVARKFVPLLSAAGMVDARLYANAKTLAELPADLLKLHEKKLIKSTPEEEALFASSMLDWNTEGMPQWEELMAGTGIAQRYAQVLRRIYQVFPFDVLLHWGENGAVSLFQQERPFTRIGMELGCTRPPFMNSLVMDLFGTNGAALVPKLTVSDIQHAVGNTTMPREEAVFAFSENIEAVPHEASFYPLDKSLVSELLEAKKCVFLPLQLYDDANLLRFSKYKTVEEVVLDVVPRLTAHGYTVIIKPHPASKHRSNAILANSIAHAALKPWASQVIWCDRPDVNYNNVQLIQLTDFTVTVNSSVGFEALYFDKPVVVLGDAVYKPKDLFPTLDAMLDQSFDLNVYLKNIGTLRQFMLGAYLQPDALMGDPGAFHRMVSSLHSIYADCGDDAAGVAASLYRAHNASMQRLARQKAFAGLSVAGGNEFSIPAPPGEDPKPAAVTADERASWLYLKIARKLLQQSECSDFQRFEAWLHEKFSTAAGRWEAAIYGEMVDIGHYMKSVTESDLGECDPVEHFLEVGIHHGFAAQAHLQVTSHEELVRHIAQAARKLCLDASDIEVAPPLSARRKMLSEAEASLGRTSAKLCVVVHLYYVDLVPEALDTLKNITCPFDLIVTMPNWGGRKIRALVQAAYPGAVFYECDNSGRDIGAFVDLLPFVLKKNYDLLLKIQSKRSYFRSGKMLAPMGEYWRKCAYAALVGSPAKVKAIVSAFEQDPALNMVGPHAHCASIARYPYHDGGAWARSVLDGLARREGPGVFFAGAMFWVRPGCLAPLIAHTGLTSVDFDQESVASDGARAQQVERIFGELASVDGGHLATVTSEAEDTELQAAAPMPISIDEHIRTSMAAADALQRSRSKAGALIW